MWDHVSHTYSTHRNMRFTASFLALYLLVGSLFPGSDFGQMQSIPYLIDHFQEHRELSLQEGQPMGFLDFLRIHFWETKDHSEKHPLSEHNKLPLQHIGTHVDMTFEVSPFHVRVPQFEIPEATFNYLDQSGVFYAPMILEPPIA